jgi:hypothetical protein
MCGCCFRVDGSCRARLPRAAARACFPSAALALALLCTILAGTLPDVLGLVIAVAITVGAAWALCAPKAAVAAAAAAAATVAAAAEAPSASAPQDAETGSLVAVAKETTASLGAGPAAAAAAAAAAASVAPASRLAYIDNLKTVLTAIVVVHHVLGAFAGGGSLGLSVGNFRNGVQPFLIWLQILDQSWFMCAFFFLAGLVAPPSLRRKGAHAFMADRLRRLGVPFSLYFWLVAPSLTAFVDAAVVGRGSSYTPSAGPPWFLAWLLIFSVCLALASDGGRVEPDFVVCARPSLLVLCGVGTALGALQFVEIIFVPGLVLMPITFGSFPLDCAFFFAGVLASRNGWLDAAARREGEGAEAGVLAFALVSAACLGAAFRGGADGLVSVNACDAWPSRGDAGLLTIAVVLVLCVCGGAFAVAALVASLDLFRHRFDAHTPASAFLAQHAFAAYLVHPVAVVPLTGAFIAIMRLSTGSSFFFPTGVDFSDCLGANAEGALLAGFVVVTALALPLTLALAVVAKRLPLLRDLL